MSCATEALDAPGLVVTVKSDVNQLKLLCGACLPLVNAVVTADVAGSVVKTPVLTSFSHAEGMTVPGLNVVDGMFTDYLQMSMYQGRQLRYKPRLWAGRRPVNYLLLDHQQTKYLW